MKELTEQELIELAKKEIDQDYYDNSFDVGYYQQSHQITDGDYRLYTHYLYHHYTKWSSSPISIQFFLEYLKLNKKDNKSIYINKELCNINVDILIGEYVKKERKEQKEKRIRKIPSTES